MTIFNPVIKKNQEIIPIGTFQMGETAVVSDPCYQSTSINNQKLNVTPGVWNASVIKTEFINPCDEKDKRCSHLLAFLENETISIAKVIGTAGVDSAQMGIFNLEYYRDDSQFPDDQWPSDEWSDKNEKFYGFCCDITIDVYGLAAGVIPFGCVSESGFGDGVYEVTAGYNKAGNIVAIGITFIEEDEEDEE